MRSPGNWLFANDFHFFLLILRSPFDTGDRCFIGGKSLGLFSLVPDR